MGLSSLPARSPFVPLSLFERQLVQSPFVSPPAVTGGSARQRCAHSARQSSSILRGPGYHFRSISACQIHDRFSSVAAFDPSSMVEEYSLEVDVNVRAVPYPFFLLFFFFFLFFHFFSSISLGQG